MPPKRKQPAAAAPSKVPTKRRSKLAKDNDITAEEEAEIQEAFSLFTTSDPSSPLNPIIAASDIRRCLVALNAPPRDATELAELLDTVDPEATGWVSYEHFVAIAALKMKARDNDPEVLNEEVEKAHQLFTKGEDRPITLRDLRRVAAELREEVSDAVLKDMVREATGGGLGGVSREEFEGVMRRAGLFS